MNQDTERISAVTIPSAMAQNWSSVMSLPIHRANTLASPTKSVTIIIIITIMETRRLIGDSRSPIIDTKRNIKTVMRARGSLSLEPCVHRVVIHEHMDDDS